MTENKSISSKTNLKRKNKHTTPPKMNLSTKVAQLRILRINSALLMANKYWTAKLQNGEKEKSRL